MSLMLKLLAVTLLLSSFAYAQNTGKSVPLLQVANIIPEWQYAKIKRLDICYFLYINLVLLCITNNC